MDYAARPDPDRIAADPIAAIERLRRNGWTVAAACAAIGMTRSVYYRRRDRSRQGRNAGAGNTAARRNRRASAGLHAMPVHWTAETAAPAWFSLAPPWSAIGAHGFSPFAILKAAPTIRDPRRRKPAAISERLAPVVDRTAMIARPASMKRPLPIGLGEPLRVRRSLGDRPQGLLAPLTAGLGGAAAWAVRGIGQAAAPLLLAALCAWFGVVAMATAANPSAMHLSRAPAPALTAIADIE
jgi:hypothetical protein